MIMMGRLLKGATHCKDLRDKVQDYLDSGGIIEDQKEVRQTPKKIISV